MELAQALLLYRFHVCMALESALARRTEEHEQTSESQRKAGKLGSGTRASAIPAKQTEIPKQARKGGDAMKARCMDCGKYGLVRTCEACSARRRYVTEELEVL